MHFKAVQIKQPGHGPASHAPSPAMHAHLPSRAGGANLLGLIDEGDHPGSEHFKSYADSRLPALLFVGSTYFFSFLVGKEGKGVCSGYVGMGVLGGTAHVEDRHMVCYLEKIRYIYSAECH